MTGKKYIANVEVVIQVEFEDDGDLVLPDQAHEAAAAFYSADKVLSATVIDIEEAP